MIFDIEFLPAASRQFDKLPVFIQKQLQKEIDCLASNPFPIGSTKMVGFENQARQLQSYL